MTNLAHKLKNRALRKNRIRSTVNGTTERPRLTVYVSNLHITAQIIDDSQQITLAYATTVGKKGLEGTMTEKATAIGEEIAKAAKTAKVSKVAFDRGGRLYHGRVKALADAARTQGLEF
jgi:large subunit ribosomal protein L18